MLPAAFQPFFGASSPVCHDPLDARELVSSRTSGCSCSATRPQVQYERELLFSQVRRVDAVRSSCVSIQRSTRPTRSARAELPVSDQAIYDKLQCMELGVSAALVEDSATRLAPVIDALGARSPDWVRGYRCRILDGNHLSKTERRIKELRSTWAAAMPGKVLAVYEPATDLVTHVCLTPDGHAQERALVR